jgi:uncharacterized RDD family membrane protein YckC
MAEDPPTPPQTPDPNERETPPPPPHEGQKSPSVPEQKAIVDNEEGVVSAPEAHAATVNEGKLLNRILGGVIDALVAIALSWAVILLMDGFLERFSWLVATAYWIVRDSLPFMNCRSLGKMAMGLKVVKSDGSSLANDWQTGFYRNIILAIPFFGALIELIVLLSRQGQAEAGKRLGDDWAKTKVVAV